MSFIPLSDTRGWGKIHKQACGIISRSRSAPQIQISNHVPRFGIIFHYIKCLCWAFHSHPHTQTHGLTTLFIAPQQSINSCARKSRSQSPQSSSSTSLLCTPNIEKFDRLMNKSLSTWVILLVRLECDFWSAVAVVVGVEGAEKVGSSRSSKEPKHFDFLFLWFMDIKNRRINVFLCWYVWSFATASNGALIWTERVERLSPKALLKKALFEHRLGACAHERVSNDEFYIR